MRTTVPPDSRKQFFRTVFNADADNRCVSTSIFVESFEFYYARYCLLTELNNNDFEKNILRSSVGLAFVCARFTIVRKLAFESKIQLIIVKFILY